MHVAGPLEHTFLTLIVFHTAAAVEYSRIETVPSDEPTAKISPSS
jgi:hypothetical protein